MKCQYCHEHDAVNTFVIAFPGGQQEIHLCEHCTRMAQQYYNMSRSGAAGSEGEAAKRKLGSIPFPDTASPAIRHKRRLNMLRARLDDAVAQEHYEEAARLRDQIAASEKEVVLS